LLLDSFFKAILDEDFRKFGYHPVVDVEDLVSADLPRAQREVEDAMAGTVTVFTDSEDSDH
jgi:hypothetical protein